VPPEPRPLSANAQRARRLLAGGAAGGHAAALIAVAAWYLVGGPIAALNAALAAVLVLAFFGLGQAVQVWVADADPQVVMIAALGSYVFRVGLPTLVLILLARDPSRFAGMHRVAIAVTAIVVVVGWLAAEIWTFSRLRIPVFDPPEGESR
jgi:hypothetical protein